MVVLVIVAVLVIVPMLLRITVAGWGSRAKLGLILSGEDLFLVGIANEALRLGAIMFHAPIATSFKICNEINVAQGAYFFWNPMLHAPPAVMRVVGAGSGCVWRCWLRRAAATIRCDEHCGDE
jgi:hypothetical protein